MPEVRERMLSDDDDLRRLAGGVRWLATLLQDDAFQRIAERVQCAAGTPAEVLAMPEAQLHEALLRHSGDAQHPTSSCAMGRVVDADCRVLGVQGLRVVDCSVMPECVRANTHLTALAIAERMAAVLLAEASS
jgi:choline dehydrogenase